MSGRVLTSRQPMYAADKARGRPVNSFDRSIGVKQGCSLGPLLFSLYLHELESPQEEALDKIGRLRLAEILIAMILFADDIALFSYS